ncbi:tRNA (adenosine(37)-N6)-threonylcarbamoyltransferase complex ATPase subunit type 1 TsaE [Desulfoferrobacter suflitae]|uniref:tRNA (adenosine(37)-N6)-threonylcarbamoyltransferase complex ATPase subunit type 1 TsaE n=1 Tax=Desulfoferrobacter suflitae TaxID=2865782 RepID=UPI00216435CE|nr:tRNA (adenosine(37)-N6)-threonylcarbamoyltransferase complex ATPase subunit type 1 TsaE [Desulfoferrobacter suflitae]MCK8601093.1 tRNA (adenosine(37)-N6)-threonylcarbamoyltransferase complex ATPase subunit type 1 TsaE [Desulfoferrobacter suflitae]
MKHLTLSSANEDYSCELGRRIGAMLATGDILALWGELGAGKTLLARGIARGLGVPSSIPVTSPTFTFINEYHGRLHLYHLDLYRLGDWDELDTLPWREALYGTGVAIIEWPDRLGPYLPEERFDVRITITGDASRSIDIIAHGDLLSERLAAWSGKLA